VHCIAQAERLAIVLHDVRVVHGAEAGRLVFSGGGLVVVQPHVHIALQGCSCLGQACNACMLPTMHISMHILRTSSGTSSSVLHTFACTLLPQGGHASMQQCWRSKHHWRSLASVLTVMPEQWVAQRTSISMRMSLTMWDLTVLMLFWGTSRAHSSSAAAWDCNCYAEHVRQHAWVR